MSNLKVQSSSNNNSNNSNILATHCINLNEQASMGDIDNLIGRRVEIQRTIESSMPQTKK
ncbi:MAG UNVERIFIED_CONTAM: hypothetical protein LVQ98_08775 [Rickettsiaceae bacterium]